MGLFLKDTFTGTAGATVQSHTPDVGGAWSDTTNFSQFTAGGAALLTGSGSLAVASWSEWVNAAAPATNEYDVAADFVNLSASVPALYLTVRSVAKNNGGDTYGTGYNFGRFPSGANGPSSWGLCKGFASYIGDVAGTYAAGTTDHVHVTVRNSGGNPQVTCFVNNVQVLQVTDSSSPYTGAGGVGFSGNAGTASASNTGNGNSTAGILLQNLWGIDAGTALTGATLTAGTVTNSTAALTWLHSFGGTAPYSYQLQRAPDVAGSPGSYGNIGSAVGTASASDSGLTAATSYWYRIVTTDGASATVNGTAVKITTAASTAASSVAITGPASVGDTKTSTNFTLTPNGVLSSGTTVALSDALGATVTPSSLTGDDTTRPRTFTVAPSRTGPRTVAASGGGLSAARDYKSLRRLNVVCKGDSLTFGEGSTAGRGNTIGTSYPALLLAALDAGAAAVTLYNKGVAGESAGDMITAGASEVDSLLDSGAINVCLFMGGINDLNVALQADAPTTYGRVHDYCLARRTAGWFVGVSTLLPATPTFLQSDADRLSVNTSIRSGYTGFADFLIDVAGDATMGAAGAYSNTTYYADGVHPTDAGYALLYPYFRAAVMRALYRPLLRYSTTSRRRAV